MEPIGSVIIVVVIVLWAYGYTARQILRGRQDGE